MTTPTLTATVPIDGATEVSGSASISLTFSIGVRAGTGSVRVFDASNDQQVAAQAASAFNIAFPAFQVATWTSPGLDDAKAYYILVDADAFEQRAAPNDPFGGISDKTLWAFSTIGYVAPSASPRSRASVRKRDSSLR